MQIVFGSVKLAFSLEITGFPSFWWPWSNHEMLVAWSTFNIDVNLDSFNYYFFYRLHSPMVDSNLNANYSNVFFGIHLHHSGLDIGKVKHIHSAYFLENLLKRKRYCFNELYLESRLIMFQIYSSCFTLFSSAAQFKGMDVSASCGCVCYAILVSWELSDRPHWNYRIGY